MGLLLAFMLAGLAAPVSYAHAWSLPSFLGWTSSKASTALSHAEPQNSQNMAFLEAAMNVDPNPAKGGGDITVVDDSALLPDMGPSGTIADVESNNRQGRVSLYVVRKGDTLPQIAKMFGVNANTILWANDLEKDASLRDGQTLVILPVNGVQHTVKKGDTIKSIAKKYKGDVDEILAFNDIEAGSQISVGDVIIIPDGEEVSIIASKTSPQTTSSKRIASYPSYTGYYSHPVPAGHKTQGIHGYNGVDFGAPVGAPIYAAAEGTVIVSRFRTLSNPWFGGYGNYVIIEHPNGTQTLYGHMSAVYVAVGARLDKGQPIGEVGNTGKSTGAHLHFEVRGAKNPF
jgi:murein DD-endopeptidase MepM/ murein hydrolase activator NlpD